MAMRNQEGQDSLASLTLARLFELKEGDFASQVCAAIVGSQILAPLETQLLAEMKYFPWKNFLSSLGMKAIELFQIQAEQLLVTAWAQYRILSEYADPSKHPPEETSSVPIAQHTISSDHQPYLQVIFHQQKYRVVFDVHFQLVIKELVLQIQAGKIRAVQSGSLEGSGTISLGSVELARKEWRAIRLPGRISIEHSLNVA